MDIPSQELRINFWHRAYARSAFIETASYLDTYLASLKSEGASLPLPMSRALIVAIGAAYGRPFKKTKRGGPSKAPQAKALKLENDLIPTEYGAIHQLLLEIRDKVTSHRDLDAPIAEWGFLNELTVLVEVNGWSLNTKSPHRMSVEHIESARNLCTFLIKQMDTELHLFISRYFTGLQVALGEYVVSLEEDPGENWFKCLSPSQNAYHP